VKSLNPVAAPRSKGATSLTRQWRREGANHKRAF